VQVCERIRFLFRLFYLFYFILFCFILFCFILFCFILFATVLDLTADSNSNSFSNSDPEKRVRRRLFDDPNETETSDDVSATEGQITAENCVKILDISIDEFEEFDDEEEKGVEEDHVEEEKAEKSVKETVTEDEKVEGSKGKCGNKQLKKKEEEMKEEEQKVGEKTEVVEMLKEEEKKGEGEGLKLEEIKLEEESKKESAAVLAEQSTISEQPEHTQTLLASRIDIIDNYGSAIFSSSSKTSTTALYDADIDMEDVDDFITM